LVLLSLAVATPALAQFSFNFFATFGFEFQPSEAIMIHDRMPCQVNAYGGYEFDCVFQDLGMYGYNTVLYEERLRACQVVVYNAYGRGLVVGYAPLCVNAIWPEIRYHWEVARYFREHQEERRIFFERYDRFRGEHPEWARSQWWHREHAERGRDDEDRARPRDGDRREPDRTDGGRGRDRSRDRRNPRCQGRGCQEEHRQGELIEQPTLGGQTDDSRAS
jgi:hypothetical protein